MRKYNKAHFRNDIQQVEWETILSPYCDNIMDMATVFQEIFESILDIHAPLRSVLERDKLKVQAGNSPEIWSAYKRKRNQVAKRIRISIWGLLHWANQRRYKRPQENEVNNK